jgi:acylphosphatase
MGRTGAEIVVEGDVQGVGYRYFAQRKAQALGLAGYATNLRDGRVKVRVEGNQTTIEEYLRDLEKGPPLARVARVSTAWCPFTGKFRGFDIRFTEFD